MGLRAIVIAGLSLAGVGCTSFAAQEELTLDLGTVADFRNFVQPVLRDTCTSMDCHGDIGRPLRLYAHYGLRLDASLRNEDESDLEIEANILSMASVDPDRPAADNLVVLKPLATFEGGIDHIGGDIWADRNAEGYRCLEAWLAGSLPGDAAAEQACASAPRVE